MEIPWKCDTCGSENWIDPSCLIRWNFNKIVVVEGFICKDCKALVPFFYTTTSMDEAMMKLRRNPNQYHLLKALKKAMGLRERIHGQSECSHQVGS